MHVFLKRCPSGPTLSRFTAVLNSVGKIQLANFFLIPLIKEWKPQEFWALLTFHLPHLLSEHKATSESHPENTQISSTFMSSSVLLPWGGDSGGSGFTLATLPDFIPNGNLAPFTPNKRAPWTSRRPSPLILKEINPEYSLEGLMLKLQYFGHTLEKSLMLGEIEGRRENGAADEMVGGHHWLNGHESEQTLGDTERQERLVCCSPRGHKESDTTLWPKNSNANNTGNVYEIILECSRTMITYFPGRRDFKPLMFQNPKSFARTTWDIQYISENWQEVLKEELWPSLGK